MKLPCFRCFALLMLALSTLTVLPTHAAQDAGAARAVWQLLDYIAVDYAVAVEAIARKAPTDKIAALARALGDAVVAAYPITLAPSTPPDPGRGQTLYEAKCASCHGANGAGKGPAARGLEPPPIAFTDGGRARQRSVFALFQVIDQGIDGTAMAGYEELASQNKWALAFYAGGLAFSDEQVRRGQQLWDNDASVRALFPDLESLTRTTPAALARRLGNTEAMAVMAYLRHHPEAVASSTSAAPLAIARQRLEQSQSAYQSGNHRRARDLALAAYLDGFEPVEPALSIRNSALLRQIETAMTELRTRIGNNAPVTAITAQVQTITALLDKADRAISADAADRGTSFVAAFTILLREGLEALLIIIAMVAFLRKAKRSDMLRFVHGGWITALAAGALTWVAARNLIAISGAGRELGEGIGALLAAVVLVSVGIWMHGKSQAGAWQHYIQQKMSRALSRRSAWLLFLLAFVVVYREVFETILFFAALWRPDQASAIVAGVGAAAAVLAASAWALLSYSKRLPIARFFFWSSIMIALLAVVLAGKGIAALQESGWFSINPVAELPRLEILGMYPTWEGIAGQALVLGILLAVFGLARRREGPV